MLLAITSRTDSYLQFLTVLLLFVFVLVITYFTTRWIARYQKVKSNADNLEVIETCRITSNKYLQIVRAGTKYVLIAIGKDEVHMLTELSEEELMLTTGDGQQQMDFSKVFANVKNLGKKEKE